MAVRRMDLIITSNAQAAIRGFASLEGAAKRVENRFGKAGRALFNLGVIGATATAVFTAKSVQAFIQFDDAMTRSTAILDNISGPVRKRLEDAAKAIARTTTFSATEAAEAFYGLFSAGLDAEQSISAIPVVAQFAQAALMDMGAATDYLVNAQSALGLSMDDPIENMKQMQRVADVLTETNNLATGTVEEFAEALTHKAGGALRTVNKDIEEGAAVLAFFADQGIRGSRAGESLAVFIRDVSRAAGNPTFKDAFHKFGIEVFNSSGQLKNLADVVAEFEVALGPMSDKQRAVTLEQLGLTRSVGDVIRQLMGGSGAIRDYESALRDAGGATKEVADNQMESLKSKLEVIKNRLNVLMIDFGEPVAIWLVDVFFPWLEFQLMPALSEVGTKLRDELQPAFEGIGAALKNPNVVKALVALTAFLVAAKGTEKIVALLGSLAFLGRVIGFLAHPIVAIAGGLETIGIIALYVADAIVFVGQVIIGVLAAPIAIISQLFLFLMNIMGQTGLMFYTIAAAIYIFRRQIVGFFDAVWDAIYDKFVGPIIRFFSGPFIDFWKDVWHKVETPLRVFLRVVQVIGSILLAVILAPFIIAAGIIIAIAMPIIHWFQDNWTAIGEAISLVWTAIATATSYFWNEIIFPRIKAAWDLIFGIVKFFLNLIILDFKIKFFIARTIITTTFDIIKAILLATWHFLRDRVFAPMGAIWEVLILPKLQQFWAGAQVIWDGIKTAFQSSWHWIRDNVLKPLANFWENSIMPKIEAFALFMGLVWANIKDSAASAWNGIVAAIRHPVNAIIRIINALIEGINTVTGLINKIPGVDIPEIPTIPLIGGGGGGSAPVAQGVHLNPGMAGVAHAMGTYDLSKRGPFMTNGPRAIVGEGDPRYREYVIPTDPRFRGRSSMLFAALARDLGIGMQFGGIIDSVKDGIGGAISAAGGLLEDIGRGALKAAFTPFNEAAKRGLNAVPDFLHMREIADGFRELIWQVVTGADAGFPEQPTGGAGGGASGAGLQGNRAANRRLGMMLNAARGWAFMWSALDALVMSESGWNNFAQNPTSTAFGIGQFLDSTWAGVGYSKTSNPYAQISAMLDYIGQRYGNPSRAWAFKKANNWYEMGGQLQSYATGLYRVPTDNFPASLDKDEMVLKASDAGLARRNGIGGTTIHIENFHLHIDGAGSIEDARRKGVAARKAFLGTLEERRVLTDARIS